MMSRDAKSALSKTIRALRARLLGVLSVCIGMGPIGFLYLGFLAEVLTPRVASALCLPQWLTHSSPITRLPKSLNDA